jgi:predicted metallopeptidase
VKKLARCDINDILEEIKGIPELSYLDKERISFIVSRGSTSNAYAKIYGLHREIQVGFGIPPIYVIEFLCEKVSSLNIDEAFIILIHELLHIPPKFSGGLRPHGKHVNNFIARKLSMKITHEVKAKFYERVSSCCDEKNPNFRRISSKMYSGKKSRL